MKLSDSKQDALNYLTWTYFFRRLLMNPNYYNLESIEGNAINDYLSELVQKTVKDRLQGLQKTHFSIKFNENSLEFVLFYTKKYLLMILKNFGALIKELSLSGVVEIDEDDNNQLYATGLGKIASFYYLQHLTARHFARTIVPTLSIAELMQILTEAEEFAELPVRHNEDNENEHLAKQMPLEVDSRQYDSPAVKAHLLLQCHMHRGVLPSSDYLLDTKTVMDNAARVIQSMIDISAEMGHLTIVIRLVRLLQVGCPLDPSLIRSLFGTV